MEVEDDPLKMGWARRREELGCRPNLVKNLIFFSVKPFSLLYFPNLLQTFGNILRAILNK
jgi:hypothetical protein